MTSNSLKPPLLLLAGLLCDETIWKASSEYLRTCDFRIVSFPDFNSIEGMASYVLEIAPPEFAVIGHSMGGRVALEVIRKGGHRVRGLGLFNTGVHPRRDSEFESRGALVRLAHEKGMSAVASAWLPSMMGASAERVAEVMPALTQMVLRNTPKSFAAQINALLYRPDAASVLATVRAPTLLASGTNDRWSPLSQHAEMQRLLPQSTLTKICDAGHMTLIEQPLAVAAAINHWLTQL